MASIRKRELPSGRFVWLVDYRDQNGRRRAKQFARRREADRFLQQAHAEVSTGVHVHDADSVTVAMASQAWLQDCDARQRAGRRMERATLRDYESKVRLHILDPDVGIGGVLLAQLNRRAVIQLRDRLLESGRSEASVRKVLSTLQVLVRFGQDQGWIAINPVADVTVHRDSRIGSRVTIPGPEQIKTLIDAAHEDFRPLLLVAVLCGLRASETRGLTWQDIDFEDGYIHVRQRADAFNEIGEPKSHAGARSVPMGPLVANALRHWRLRCPTSELSLVFPSRRGTIQSHSNILKRRFKPLCRKVGLELRWHDLRHFAVSTWIQQGFSVKEVMTFAGHASVQMTMERYGHLFPSPEHHRGMAEIETRLLG
jgi:integrase